MRNYEKEQIYDLVRQGLKISEIAKETGLNDSTIRSFLLRHPLPVDSNICKNCGKHLDHTPGKKAKMFCSDKCKSSWWNKHKYQSKSCSKTSCACCGKVFISFDSEHRKYCSQKCYRSARYSKDFQVRKFAV